MNVLTNQKILFEYRNVALCANRPNLRSIPQHAPMPSSCVQENLLTQLQFLYLNHPLEIAANTDAAAVYKKILAPICQ